MLPSDRIKPVDNKEGYNRAGGGGGLAKQKDILTLFKEFRHDVLVVVSCFYFFSNM